MTTTDATEEGYWLQCWWSCSVVDRRRSCCPGMHSGCVVHTWNGSWMYSRYDSSQRSPRALRRHRTATTHHSPSVYTNIILITIKLHLPSFTFVRRSCSILLPILAMVVKWCGKKSVVHVAQCIQLATLVPVHRTPSFLSDVHCFLTPSGTSMRLPVQDYRFWPPLALSSSRQKKCFCLLP